MHTSKSHYPDSSVSGVIRVLFSMHKPSGVSSSSRSSFVPYITARPVCTTHRFQRGRDRYLILGSDGLFGWKSNTEVVQDVHTLLSVPGNAWSSAADHVVKRTLWDKVCHTRVCVCHRRIPCVSQVAPSRGIAYDALLALSPDSKRKVHDDLTVIVINLSAYNPYPDEAAGDGDTEARESKRRHVEVIE